MDHFTAYAKQATSKQPAKLLGPMKTRAQLRDRYTQIVAEMAACADPAGLEAYLAGIAAETTQFHAEHEFFWAGDGDFLGLEREIERARARVDDRLDMPRWDN